MPIQRELAGLYFMYGHLQISRTRISHFKVCPYTDILVGGLDFFAHSGNNDRKLTNIFFRRVEGFNHHPVSHTYFPGNLLSISPLTARRLGSQRGGYHRGAAFCASHWSGAVGEKQPGLSTFECGWRNTITIWY